MKSTPRSIYLLLSLVSFIFLTACASAPAVRYYSLSPAHNTSNQAPAGRPLLVELPPLALPERLARSQLVLRTPDGQLALLDLHRWSAPFGTELGDALASGIVAQLGAVDVSGGGRLAGQPVYRIAVQLRQWEAQENQRLDAGFSWTLRRSDDARNLACQWVGSEALGPGVVGVVEGAQRLSAQAAQRIATALAALDADATAQCPR